jgi:replication initiation and membrane attachment protein DnaB
LKQGEKISNIENASQKSYSFTFDHLQKNFEEDLQKNLQKTKHVVQAWLHYANQFNYALLYLLWFVLASITKKGDIERELGLHLFPK